MSEREEYSGPSFEVGGHEFTPENSQLFLHSEMPEADHFRLQKKGSIFRKQVDNFQELAQYAEDGEYTIFRSAYPLDETLKVYIERFGPLPLPELNYITPRKEKQIKFGMHLLNTMTVEELFGGEA